MTYISFCSGIEAATAAWHPLGWQPVAFCEIDKFASRVLAHHYPEVPNLGDFTKVDWSQYSADICVGGTPCQAFSVAGLRNSLADERGNLTLEFVRAINIIRPHTVVWENVPGVLSTSDNAFGCFLAALVGCDEPIVFEQGWPNAGVVDGPDRRAAWRILDAQYFGLAQRRKRVFVVANSGDRPHPAELLLEWEGLRRDSPPSRTTGEGAATTIAARTRGGGGLGTDFECSGGTVAMCLNGGGMNRIDAESETFVAYPLQLTNQGKGGNLPYGSDTDPQFCLTREGCQGVAYSLRADGFDAGEDGTGRVTPLVPLAIQAGALRENPESGPDGVGVQEHIAYTLEARAEVEAIAFSCKDHGSDAGDIAPTLRSMGHDGSHANGGGQVAVAVTDTLQYTYAVRRLLPSECESLMGFPRGFTKIPGPADGPRYRSLGNSMAVPVMAWIGRRIKEAYAEE
jgi:DNA (cytosine-5)-methyltransferase 1